MRTPRSALLMIASVGFAALALSSCNKAKAPAEAPTATQENATTASYSDNSAGSAAPIKPSTVEPQAIDALKNMSKYLMSLNTLKIESNGTLDVVTEDGQRIQLDGQTTYKVKRPGFVIQYVSDIKNRDFYYDGKQFTEYSPKLGMYATAPAPGTNQEAFQVMYQKYGLKLPLEDLFRWNDTGNERIDQIKEAVDLGPSVQDGVQTTHYAFREPTVDWEVWIKDGDQPLPVKLTIVDRTDPARPGFTTRLKWTVNPSFSDADFTFKPGKDDKKIPLAQYEGQ